MFLLFLLTEVSQRISLSELNLSRKMSVVEASHNRALRMFRRLSIIFGVHSYCHLEVW